jgi:hypothetical protein
MLQASKQMCKRVTCCQFTALKRTWILFIACCRVRFWTSSANTLGCLLWPAAHLVGALDVARARDGMGGQGPSHLFSASLRGLIRKSCAHKYSCKLLVLIKQKQSIVSGFPQGSGRFNCAPNPSRLSSLLPCAPSLSPPVLLASAASSGASRLPWLSHDCLLWQCECCLHDSKPCSAPAHEAHRDRHSLRMREGGSRAGSGPPRPVLSSVCGHYDQGSAGSALHRFQIQSLRP